jgi:hypothetical protein
MGEGQGSEGRLDSLQKTPQDVGFGDRAHSRCSKGSLGQMAEAKEDSVNPIRASWWGGLRFHAIPSKNDLFGCIDVSALAT